MRRRYGGLWLAAWMWVGCGSGQSGTEMGSDDGGAVADAARPNGEHATSPFDWVGIIGTGQSLSVGWESTAISTTQPFKNLKLKDDGPDPKYPIDGTTTAKWSAVPLTEPARVYAPSSGQNVPGYDDYEYPNNYFRSGDSYGESPNTAMGNTLSALWLARGKGDYISAHSVVGWAGMALTNIDKTGGKRPYLASLSETRVFKTLADTAGRTYGVGGIILTHGETDANNTMYESQLFQLWQDYNADIKAITGQSRDVVIFTSQESSTSGGSNGSPVQMWRAGLDHPGQIICTGPKYAYGPYGLHMPAASYERLGEKYGEIFDLVVNQGVAWKPLGPNKVTRVGAEITVDFDVPNPPLVWDTHLAPPHATAHPAWKSGKGFEVSDGSGELDIAAAEIKGSSVVLTLASTPAAGATLTVAYAITADQDGAAGGSPAGVHGLLRDSDDFTGYDHETFAVMATNGSDMLTADPSVVARRAAMDLVTGGGVDPDTIVLQAAYGGITLSSKWTGATGMQMLSFRHNQYNYAVHFSMPVP